MNLKHEVNSLNLLGILEVKARISKTMLWASHNTFKVDETHNLKRGPLQDRQYTNTQLNGNKMEKQLKTSSWQSFSMIHQHNLADLWGGWNTYSFPCATSRCLFLVINTRKMFDLQSSNQV